MKKLAIVFLLGMTSLLTARTITIINNTGALVRARISFAECKPIEQMVPSTATEEGSEQAINIGNCCFTTVALTVMEGAHQGKSINAVGVRAADELRTCREATTFMVQIKDNKLEWFRK